MTEAQTHRFRKWTAYTVVFILGGMAVVHAIRDTIDPRMPAQYCPKQ